MKARQPRKPTTITLEPPKARQGVPAHLAARYRERQVQPKKGKGAIYKRSKCREGADREAVA